MVGYLLRNKMLKDWYKNCQKKPLSDKSLYMPLFPGTSFRVASSSNWGFQERDIIVSSQGISRVIQEQYKW